MLEALRLLFRTKSLDLLIEATREGGAPSEGVSSLDASGGLPARPALKKVLGASNVVALGIGAIIGAGIFATIGTAAAGDRERVGAGPALVLSFILTAIVCGFTALCYAEFAAMVPVAGSAYTYAYATLGEIVAWIIGWDLILEYAIGNTAVAISWANYLNTLLANLDIHVPGWLTTDYRTAFAKFPDVVANAPHVLGVPIVFNVFAVGIVTLISAVLVWGVRESARLNAAMVLVKLVVLAFFALMSIGYVKSGNFTPFAPNGFRGIGTGAAIIFFAFIGFDAVSTCAEECKNPKRDMPIGIIGSLVICTVIYVVIAAIFTGMIPFSVLREKSVSEQAEPLTMAMQYVSMPKWMVGVVALGSVVAHTAVLLVFQLGQPRILLAMARDGFLPPVLARVHPRFRTPHVSTILTGTCVGLVSAVANIDEMVDLTNIGTLFAFILVSLGVIVLRYREPERERPFRVPGGPLLIPSLGALSSAGLIAYLPPKSWRRFFAWLGIGLAIYAVYGYRHSVLAKARRRQLTK